MKKNNKEKIIEAALMEFSINGFDNTSTDQIVQRAGVSKGLLFYYFKNKEELFLYLLKFSRRFLLVEYIEKIDTSEEDYFARMIQQNTSKFAAFEKNPYVFYFIFSYYIHIRSNSANQQIEDLKLAISDKAYEKMREGINVNFFRTDLEIDKILRYITLICEGYEKELMQKYISKSINLEFEYEQQAQLFIDLKTLFYREDFHGNT